MQLTPATFTYAVLALSYVVFVLCYSKITVRFRQEHLPDLITWASENRGFYVHGDCFGLDVPFACTAWIAEYALEMLMCPFCTVFWVAVGTQIVLHLNAFPALGWLGFLFTIPALGMPAAIIAFWAGGAIEAKGILMAQQRAAKAAQERKRG